MSKHYSAFQFDAAYKPTALRNWEIPKYFCHRPRQRTGRTNIIANATGNLLPGVHRSQESPWGNFIGTWSMPRKIDRKTAAKMNGSDTHKMKARKCYLHYTAKPAADNEEPSKEKSQTETKPIKNIEEVASTEAQEKRSGKEEDGTVEVPKEDLAGQEGVIPHGEMVMKPLCPIHDAWS